MSSIRFHDIATGETFYVSGTERAHMSALINRVLGGSYADLVRSEGFTERLNRTLSDHPELRLLARIHGQCELGCWVAAEDRAWFAGLVRRACERTVRVKPLRDEQDKATEWSEELLRVGFSTYGEGGGWWRLTEWLCTPDGGDVVLSYSVSGWPWEGEDDDEATMRPSDPRLRSFLREQHSAYQMRPDNWETYRFGT